MMFVVELDKPVIVQIQTLLPHPIKSPSVLIVVFSVWKLVGKLHRILEK